MRPLYANDLFDTFDALEFFYKAVELRHVFQENNEIPGEKTVVGINIYGTHHNSLVVGDNTGYVTDDSDIVIAYDAQGYAVMRRTFAAPSGFHDAIAETTAQFRGLFLQNRKWGHHRWDDSNGPG